ncbi:MAG TPA: NAD-dependent epimerase/dehydratase family protein [Bacteroidota bacterium]|nr:NAD-dependent epimerase/dehydratase family protein [Bacteroidota bacterium]
MINVIVFGATGMVGEGVLHECLASPDVGSVLAIGRRSCEVQHAKVQEIIQSDVSDLSALENRLRWYHACYFCLGVSSIGMKEESYRRVTYDLTMRAARTLAQINPGMTFCYVSGLGTDSTEQGKTMWARVKGKTENDLAKLPFKAVYLFRPGFIKPTKGLKHSLKIARVLGITYPLLRSLFPRYVCTLQEVGRAMIVVTLRGASKHVLECEDIVDLGRPA